jgi:hypothetical protein
MCFLLGCNELLSFPVYTVNQKSLGARGDKAFLGSENRWILTQSSFREFRLYIPRCPRNLSKQEFLYMWMRLPRPWIVVATGSYRFCCFLAFFSWEYRRPTLRSGEAIGELIHHHITRDLSSLCLNVTWTTFLINSKPINEHVYILMFLSTPLLTKNYVHFDVPFYSFVDKESRSM